MSPRYGYSIDVPDGWWIEEVAGTGGLHPGEPGMDGFGGNNRLVTVTAVPVPAESDVASWRSPITEHYEGSDEGGHGLRPVRDELVTVDSVPARVREYRVAAEPDDQLVLDATAIIGDRAYLITYLGLTSDHAAYREEFRRIITTFALP